MTEDVLKWRFKPSAAEVVSLVAGIFLLVWYAWLMDDAYVYFRYADNLVLHGYGLVWNQGEYVEGFSSPLWALALSLLRAMHLDFWIATLASGVLCFVAFWWLACLVNRRLAGGADAPAAALNIPLLYLSLTYAVSCYFTSGLEAPLVNVLAAVYAAAVLWPRSRALQALVGLSPLVRPELALPFLLFLLYARFFRRKTPWVALLACGLTLVPYLAFRVWYYADLFPNTYYLKDMSWPRQGLKYLYDTLLPYQAVPYAIGMAAVFAALSRSRGCRALLATERVVMLALALPVLLYVVKIGGDARHFRYLAFPFILAVLATGGLAERVCPAAALPRALLVAACALAALGNYPRQLQQHPLFLRRGFSHTAFLLISDASFHRMHKTGVTPALWGYDGALSFQAARQRHAREAAAGGKQTPVIALGWCQTAYLHPAAAYIQVWGLTEAFLARTAMPADRPAHKFGLLPLAKALVPIRAKYGFGPGAFDQAVAEDPATPAWVARNIGTLRQIGQKVYNRHLFCENLRLALRPVPKIGILDRELPDKPSFAPASPLPPTPGLME